MWKGISAWRIDLGSRRIIRIRNALALDEFEASEALAEQLQGNMQRLSDPYELPFDAKGDLF